MISLTKKNTVIAIHLEADLLNTSTQLFDLEALKQSIIKQLQQVYHTRVGKYSLDISTNIRIITHENQCSLRRILFQIVDVVGGGNPAEAYLKGMRIKINKTAVTQITSGHNIRTIPHELGHLFGWNHPHANARYESINTNAHPLEQQLTEEERRHNLMSQTWYSERTNIPVTNTMKLTEQQVDLLCLYYFSNTLNHNGHLRYFLWWRKLV